MRNARLDEIQAGIKTARRNINNLRYADDTTFMAESEEELKDLLKKVKEESEKSDLILIIQKTKIMANRRQIDGETMETVADFIFLGSKLYKPLMQLNIKKQTTHLKKMSGKPHRHFSKEDLQMAKHMKRY